MKYLLCFLFFFLFFYPSVRCLKEDPDIKRDVTQMITSKGYPCELLTVTTEDDFYLGLHNMPNPGKPPVILWHGIAQNAASWTCNFPGEDLIYFLYDAGFDVYLGNSRGNNYSMSSKLYNPKKDPKDFFNNCYIDYMTKYDLPATVDYILEKTGFEKIAYVGHSQGTIINFAALASNPDYASKINFFAALAPAVFLKHTNSSLIRLVEEFVDNNNIFDLFDLFHTYNLDINNPVLKIVMSYLCKLLPTACDSIFWMVAGYDPKHLNITRNPVYVAHLDSLPLRDMKMLDQWTHTGRFQMFDFGNDQDNYIHYGQNTPPLYQLSNIIPGKAPKMMIFYGGNDLLADPYDVEHYLLPRLNPDLFWEKPIFISDYSHADFLWAQNAKDLIYKKIVNALLQLDFGKRE
ncbi:lipase [Anaeramoeba flamelloides]|uniref:Lipase n=1 Tax=Anaeramoeba flamelloides TaxID=1746091 RepID=A0ABQ8ZER6_9EUKA|nr:lipase [Anaeramoeba flamelloides]